jgi:hypothetical protein
MPRRIDHCVLPTASLDIARARLTALGFNVAPNGRHPFGTENCCVYFADGTFLEPLAIADADEIRQAIAAENVFVARDAAYRANLGDEGFSALVFASDDADADHAQFVGEGFSAGPLLTFSRPFKDAAENIGMASFKLAFAADAATPDTFFFTCQRLNAPAVDRLALEKHANGVGGIIAVECEAGTDHGDLLDTVAGTGQSVIRVVAGQPVLRLRRIVFGAKSLDDLAALLTANAVEHLRLSAAIEIPAAAGQGAAFRFESV